MLQVPFFICRYLLLNIQVPFSTRQQAIHGTVLFTPDLLTPHTAFPSLPATVPVFWNVSTHFFYPCAHSVVASSTRCHLNRRKLNTYRATRPPSWENGTWQVPSQLSHSEYGWVSTRERRNYSALAIEFHLCCTNPSIHNKEMVMTLAYLQGSCWALPIVTVPGHSLNQEIQPGPWFNMNKNLSYQYRKSHCWRDRTIVRSSYLHNGISYTYVYG